MEKPPAPPIETISAATPSQNGQVARALLSASVFGVLGGAIGHWLGVRGNEPKRQLAAPIMKWGLGIFSAILAAYSSFKASERVNAVAREQPAEPADMAVVSAVEPTAPVVEKTDPQSLHVPLTSVHAAGAEHQPIVATQPPLQRA